MFERAYPLPVPLLGLQLRGRHNPFLVALTEADVVRVSVELGECSGAPRLRVEGEPRLTPEAQLALRSFLDELSGRLEQCLEAVVYYEAQLYHPAGLYAVLTYALVEAVAEEGGYEMEAGEVAEAANSIDADAGVDLDYLDAARAAIARGRSLVYRRGEDPIEVSLGGGRVELVGEARLGGVIEDELPEELHVAISRLVGLNVALASRAVVERGWEGFRATWRIASRVENGLYYTLYGLEPPEEGCKWTPGLRTAFSVCLERGIGDEARLR